MLHKLVKLDSIFFGQDAHMNTKLVGDMLGCIQVHNRSANLSKIAPSTDVVHMH